FAPSPPRQRNEPGEPLAPTGPRGPRAVLAPTFGRFTERFDTADLRAAETLLADLPGPARSPAQVGEAPVPPGPTPKGPEVLPVGVANRQIVDAGQAARHEAAVVEFPVLVAVGPEPLPAVVVPLVGEPHGDPVLAEGPELLDQPIVQLLRPLARQE